jgi:hypothetical protein
LETTFARPGPLSRLACQAAKKFDPSQFNLVGGLAPRSASGRDADSQTCDERPLAPERLSRRIFARLTPTFDARPW